MASCYDCIHCGACSDAGDSGFSSLKEDASECKHFKNKADVVEVVRCKDCKYLTNEVILVPTSYGFDNKQINFGCQRISDITDEWADVMLDDFCSYGEKIESEVEK